MLVFPELAFFNACIVTPCIYANAGSFQITIKYSSKHKLRPFAEAKQLNSA